MIKAIIFDADGVIIDNETLWDLGQTEFLKRRGFTYDRTKTKHKLTGRSLSEGAKIMMGQYGFTGDPVVLGEERYEIMVKFYEQIAFMPGFPDFYNSIKHNYKTAIATSSHPKLFAIANDKLKLSELFGSHIYFLKDVNNVSKPEPDIFLYAAKMLGVPAAESLVVEDAPLGVEAAKRAGMKCIGLATTHGADMLQEADMVVNSFSEIDLTKF